MRQVNTNPQTPKPAKRGGKKTIITQSDGTVFRYDVEDVNWLLVNIGLVSGKVISVEEVDEE